MVVQRGCSSRVYAVAEAKAITTIAMNHTVESVYPLLHSDLTWRIGLIAIKPEVEFDGLA